MSQDIANKVLKNMKEYKYNKMASSRGVSIKPTNIDVGYIVRVNNGSNGNSNSNYLIWNKDEEYLYGFKIDKSTKKQATKNKLTYFLADNLLYKAEYDDEIKVLSTDKINIKGILSNDDFGEVLAKRSQYRLVNPSIGNLDGNSEYKQLLKELKKTTY